ncbi:hypothetical protein H7J07_04730 [Mycobacterium koreense]|uniref:Uncharacterized protein n=1 Tax=Mycolicibacillus koreensis TaxID=1069220 RepID=A0A7I7SC19_9MYCO|nr:hypothetical protein [Mycolicibacillus koreensis]MCV7247562.1 hypothetical protein [Mycolicibacillus koreensis]OSC32856.1 hypothetical protein B8W67_14150 [Mycolicibacillus koreensis]BBY53941.1 hypothetical protein MKOR_11920 [Mycolicibacillus koreensis]
MANELHLNIPGAMHNVAEMQKSLQIIDTEAADQLSAYKRLSDVMQGAGMEDADAYSIELHAAIGGIQDSVNGMTVATENACHETIDYDKVQAGSNMTGQA